MLIRKYKPQDCEEIIKLFYDTVHNINIRDYTLEQVNAWAPKDIDTNSWNMSLNEHYTLVAVKDDVIVGFGDIDKSGYLDRLYVHKDFQGLGIGTVICDELEKGFTQIIADASITAKLFFENRGFMVVAEQKVERRGVGLINFVMEKNFGDKVK